MRSTVIASTALVLTLGFMAGDPGKAHASWNQKAQHYCTYWGSAGLFPDDEKALAANPLTKLQIPLRNGTQLEFPLLYIFKGYELDESPKEWAKVWTGFAQACPGWPKPQWLQKLEKWKNANAPKVDPRIAQRKARIKALLASADSKETQAATTRARIMASRPYLAITGGQADWKSAALAKKAFLQQIVSLKNTKYMVVGKVLQSLPQGAWVNAMAVPLKATTNAPGSRVDATRVFVQAPKSGWVRPNGEFLAAGVYLLGIPTQQNPNVVFGPALASQTKVAIGKAAKDLKTVSNNLRNGEAKVASMLRPADRLEAEAKALRLRAQQLQTSGGR